MFTCILNPGSCIEAAAWQWWDSLGFGYQALIVGGIAVIIIGICWGFVTFLHKIGGPIAVGGFFVAVLALVASVMPKKPKEFTGEVDGPDAAMPVGRKLRRTAKRTPYVPPKSLIED